MSAALFASIRCAIQNSKPPETRLQPGDENPAIFCEGARKRFAFLKSGNNVGVCVSFQRSVRYGVSACVIFSLWRKAPMTKLFGLVLGAVVCCTLTLANTGCGKAKDK